MLNFFELNMMIIFVSFLGFVLENIWLAATKGYIDNRNMNLPFLFGYGLVIIGFYTLIGTPANLKITEWFGVYFSRRGGFIFYFFVSVILVSVGEMLLGTFVERIFGFEYWNYSRLPLHITKYTSVPTSMGFGLIITLFMGYFFDNIMNQIHNMSDITVKVIGSVLMLLITADFIYSFAVMYRKRSLNIKWEKRCRLVSGLKKRLY